MSLTLQEKAGRQEAHRRRWQYLVTGRLQQGHGLHVQKEVRFGPRGLALLPVLGIQLLTVDDQAPEQVQEKLQERGARASAQL